MFVEGGGGGRGLGLDGWVGGYMGGRERDQWHDQGWE